MKVRAAIATPDHSVRFGSSAPPPANASAAAIFQGCYARATWRCRYRCPDSGSDFLVGQALADEAQDIRSRPVSAAGSLVPVARRPPIRRCSAPAMRDDLKGVAPAYAAEQRRQVRKRRGAGHIAGDVRPRPTSGQSRSGSRQRQGHDLGRGMADPEPGREHEAIGKRRIEKDHVGVAPCRPRPGCGRASRTLIDPDSRIARQEAGQPIPEEPRLETTMALSGAPSDGPYQVPSIALTFKS